MSAEGDASLESVGLIYQPQIRILSEAYDEYLDGLSRAKQVFHGLVSTERYTSYVEVFFQLYFCLHKTTTISLSVQCYHGQNINLTVCVCLSVCVSVCVCPSHFLSTRLQVRPLNGFLQLIA